MRLKRLVSNFILFYAILICLGSCKDEGESIAPPCLLKKISRRVSYPGLSVAFTESYTYDNNGRLTRGETTEQSDADVYTSYYDYEYRDDLVSKVTGNDWQGQFEETWTYNNRILDKVVRKVNDESYVTAFTYSGSNLMSCKITRIGNNDIIDEIKFSYNGQNVSTIQSSAGSYIYLEYDDGNNPYSLMAKAINQPFFYMGGIGADYVSKNNFGLFSANGGFAQRLKYVYNEKRYPSKITASSVYGSVLNTLQYENCK